MTVDEAGGEGGGGGVTSRYGGLGYWSLGSCLVGSCLKQLHALPGVVLPMQHRLVIYEFATLPVHYLLPEVLKLQQIQEVKAHRVSGRQTNARNTTLVCSNQCGGIILKIDSKINKMTL